MADSGLFSSRVPKVLKGVNPDTTVLGKGGYGCVVKPVIRCKNERTNRIITENERLGKKYVSKIYTQKSADLDESISQNIFNNNIANQASKEAIKIKGVTPDFGMEIYKCDLEITPEIPACEMSLTDKSLILTELGNIDAFEIKGRKKRELIDNLIGISIKEIERAINSNLININKLHRLGYVDLDIKLNNLIPNFETPFSFKIIDYDTFQKIDSIDSLGYSQVNYFYPPEYRILGNYIYKTNLDLESYDTFSIKNTINSLRRYDGSLRIFIWEKGSPMPPVIKVRDSLIKGISDEIYRENVMALYRIKDELEGRDDKSNFKTPGFYEFITSVDYFMYAIAIYTFIYELKLFRPIEEEDKWDDLLERISRFFHPRYSLRLEAINEFLDRGKI